MEKIATDIYTVEELDKSLRTYFCAQVADLDNEGDVAAYEAAKRDFLAASEELCDKKLFSGVGKAKLMACSTDEADLMTFRFMRLLFEANDEPLAVAMVTHSAEAAAMCDRTLTLEKGHLAC